MALERFIPKSPDANIRNTQDFEVAKFGHLNTIVEYINNNSAKPAGLNGYVQFNNNNALGADADLFWDNTNKYLGIGNTTPAYQLSLSKQLYTQKGAYLAIDGSTTSGVGNYVGIGTTSPAAILHILYNYGQVVRNERISENTSGPTYRLVKGRGVIGAPTPNLIGDVLGDLNWQGYSAAGSVAFASRIQSVTTEAWSTTNRGARLDFITNQTGTTTAVTIMNAYATGINIGNTSNDLGARLGIKGSGSTSATTSLLVQNSGGTTLLQQTDDGALRLPVQSGQNISNLFIDASGFNNAVAKIGVINGGYAGQLYIQSVGSSAAGYPSATLGKAVIQAPTGLIITSNNAGALSNTDIAMYIYQSKSVHINGFTEVASAILNVDSTTKGFLLPRMTTTQRDAIATPATGLKVYNTTTNTTDTYDGATWQRFGQQTLIKGSGSTSATTSLLVQNSGGTAALTITDDSVTNCLNFKSTVGGRYISTQGGNEFFTVHDGTNALLRANAATASIKLGRGENFEQTTTQSIFNYPYIGGGFASASKPFNFKSDIQNGNGGAASRVLMGIDISGNTMNNYTEFYVQRISVNFSSTYLNAVTYAYGNTDFHNAFNTNSGSTIIGSATVNNSAKLQVDSTTQGFLPPRMTTAERTAIASPAAGLVVFDTTLQNLCYYRDGVWVQATFTAA